MDAYIVVKTLRLEHRFCVGEGPWRSSQCLGEKQIKEVLQAQLPVAKPLMRGL